MWTVLGIDVGSTTAKAVVLSAEGALLRHVCRRHRGRPREVVRDLIDEVREGGGGAEARGAAGITGSLGVAMASELGAVASHEVHAVALAARAVAPDARTVIELGGQDAKILSLDPDGAHRAEMNDRCAAGTGATLDRVALRLAMGWDALAGLRLAGDLRVASRCGVFAETDVVNLVKRGASREEAMSALVRAVVAQNLSVLARGRRLVTPVLLLGGPHAHLPALAQAWAEVLGDVRVPAHAELFAATGAALHVLRGARPLARVAGVVHGSRADGPLVRHAADRALLASLAPGPGAPDRSATRAPSLPVRAHLGVDAGSTTSKAVLLDSDGRVLAGSYAPSAGDPVADAVARIGDLERRFEDLRIESLGVTGYGADIVAPALGADWAGPETVAHAAAAHSHAPGTEVVVDVGGTDVKVLRLSGAHVVGFHVSNQCSAGHGAFLAASAADLEVPLEGYARRALGAARMPRFTVGCGIFIDTDRVTFQRDGWGVDEILAGLAWALARNVFEFVLPEPVERLGRSFLLTGGTQKNRAAAFALARYLVDRVPGAEVAVHPHPELCGAIGAARTAAGAPGGRFVGLARVPRVRTRVRTGEELRCTRCELSCARNVVEITGGSADADTALVVGNACERGADLASTGRRTRAHAPDLLAEQAARLFRPLLPPPARPRLDAPPTIGIPRVLAMYRSAPLLLAYLRAAGVPDDRIVISPPTTELLAAGRPLAQGLHDPCFPSKVALTHARWLVGQSIDALLLPAITHARIAVRGTADTASCPIVAASGHTTLAALRADGDPLADRGIVALTPELSLLDRDLLAEQLHDAFGPLLGIDSATSQRALAHGLRAQAVFHDRCRRRGRAVLSRARREGRAAAVVLARPYHADPGIQHGVSTELAARGVPVLSIDSLPVDEGPLDVSDLLGAATNSGCAEKAWAARRIAGDAHLVAVDLSSFRCGQDASVMGLLGELLEPGDRPILRLHDLDEDRPRASFSLRIETFVRTLRRYERERLAPDRRPASARRLEVVGGD